MDYDSIYYFVMQHETAFSIASVIIIPIVMGTVWEKHQIRKERRHAAQLKINLARIDAEFARNHPEYSAK